MNDKFFPELARRLKREGITTGPVEKGLLPVLLEGREVMAVASGGTIFLRPETADDQPVVNTYGVVAGISAQVYEYTEAMAAASRLEAVGLHEGFRLLADFNDVVLAGQELESDWGYKFVTWQRSFDRTGVAQGHYYDNDYAGAKLDFACRSGLVQESRQFTDEQLTELYRCVHETLDSGYPITEERWKTLMASMEQIESSVDDLEERVEQSNQRELDAAQGQTNEPVLGF
ncbi:MAG: hypothetical protein K2M15_09455 [Oscillospiraceae bacterium]|nr:hypothetical protein [Oscillospiraceae bacterium]MDE7172585.1 hypothetical protein [Oscillospiraceae bacterium]